MEVIWEVKGMLRGYQRIRIGVWEGLGLGRIVHYPLVFIHVVLFFIIVSAFPIFRCFCFWFTVGLPLLCGSDSIFLVEYI